MHSKKPEKRAYLFIQIPPDQKERLRELAKRENRKLSNFVLWVLQKFEKENPL